MRRIPRSRFSTILLLLFFCICTAGCTNITNKFYMFTESGVDYDWGKVGGRMTGSYTSTDTESIASSPYLLNISFQSKSKVDGVVTIKSIKLTGVDGKTIFYENNEPWTKEFNTKIFNETYNAIFMIRGLEPDYVRLKLYLKYTIKTDQFVKDGETDLYFITAYREYRSNKTLERLMGV